MQNVGPNNIGGLPVLIDNAYYTAGNHGVYENYASNDDYFITGLFDTGSTGSKSLTFSYTLYADSSHNCYFRLFNNITANSVDYWGNGNASHNIPGTRTITTAGQFIAFSVRKSLASSMYIYDNTNGRYIFKGNDVS